VQKIAVMPIWWIN